MDDSKTTVPKKLPPKPKVLRVDLQKRKTALEKKGWAFGSDAEGYFAVKYFNPSLTRVSDFECVADLLKTCEELEVKSKK